MTASKYIDYLQLIPHPEGGHYKETYRSDTNISKECLAEEFNGSRSVCTAIYFLLQQGDYSAFHKIKSDECWHFYAGGRLLIHMIDRTGNYKIANLGSDVNKGETMQYVVPANTWFASEPAIESSFSLVGCTVAPGFDFKDFEMADEDLLLQQFPKHSHIVKRLCRK